MKNNFTKEEIKESVEYKWRKNQLKIGLFSWGVFCIISLIVSFFIVLPKNIDHISVGLIIWGIWNAILVVIISPFMIYVCCKMNYLLKNYSSFSSYEVILDNFNMSYLYKGAIYYSVKINIEGNYKIVDTNPYFSNSLFSEISLQDLNNKKVVGLYDDKLYKFYVIKKID